MSLYFIISSAIITLYLLFTFRLYVAWIEIPEFKFSGARLPFISVVIPFKNECDNIVNLLKDLENQSYPLEKHEIILVDDHSEDNSARISEEFCRDKENMQVIKNCKGQGKKYALLEGISRSKGDHIMITDADCGMSTSWIRSFGNYFAENPHMKMVSSGVKLIHAQKFMQYYQALEFSSLVVAGASSFQQKDPILCNGANLAFKKELFLEAFGSIYPEVNTGDDMFLMLYAKKKYPGQLSFLKNKEAFSVTIALNNWKELLLQRLRWSSKSNFYSDFRLISVSLLILGINLWLLLSFVLSIFHLHFLWISLILYFLKSVADYLLLNSFLSYTGQKSLLKFFLPSQLINMIFIPLTGISGFFKSSARRKK